MARLQERYRAEILPNLMKEFGYENANEVPKLIKISVNMGIGSRLVLSLMIALSRNSRIGLRPFSFAKD